MLPDRSRDDAHPLASYDDAAGTALPGAGARYREHLDRFPERSADSALERAARALIRMAQIRTKAPPKAG